MDANIILIFVLCTWGNSATAYIKKKNCADCVDYKSCDAAVVAIEKKEAAVDAQLRRAFCGFDGKGLPMVCCSELVFAAQSRFAQSVESHPNLHLLPQSCGDSGNNENDYSPFIAGSRAAGLYEYPWMVLISYKTRFGPQFRCGGTLISKRYVLTAAHCISGQCLLGVRVGDNNVDTKEDCQGAPPFVTCESHIQDIRIEKAILHPGFRSTFIIRDDMGLLRLKKPVNFFFKNAGAICLPASKAIQNRNIEGLRATVAGWGYADNGYVSSKLLTVDVSIYNEEYCRELYNRGRKPGEEDNTINKICAGLNGSDTCKGDSGGPLMIQGPRDRYFQFGVMSYGPLFCRSKFPGVYTDVTKYMKWILDNIKP